jgi:hypothetical protein
MTYTGFHQGLPKEESDIWLSGSHTLRGIVTCAINQKMSTQITRSEVELIIRELDASNIRTDIREVIARYNSLLEGDPEIKLSFDPQAIDVITSAYRKPNVPVTAAEVVVASDATTAESIAIISDVYSDRIAASTLSEAHVNALARILDRLPPARKLEAHRYMTKRTPNEMYQWLVLNATSSWPYLTLDSAAKAAPVSKVTKKWGRSAGIWRLPKWESSPFGWRIMRDAVEAFGKSDCIVDIDFVPGEPTLDEADCIRNPLVLAVLQRIAELKRSPGSMTFRPSPSPVDYIKNLVDIEIINIVRSRSSLSWRKLAYDGSIILFSKREEIHVGKDGRTPARSYVGSALAGFTAKLYAKSPERPEGTSLYLFFRDLCELIAEEVPEDYTPPKRLFTKPSVEARRYIRAGPQVRKKDGREKANFYMPFSFTKSAECEAYPAAHKAVLSECANEVNILLDSLNNKDLNEAADAMPSAEALVKTCYVHSDELRKAWRGYASVLQDPSKLKEDVTRAILLFDKPGITWEQIDNEISAWRVSKYSLIQAESNPIILAELKAKILGSVREKTRSRPKGRG